MSEREVWVVEHQQISGEWTSWEATVSEDKKKFWEEDAVSFPRTDRRLVRYIPAPDPQPEPDKPPDSHYVRHGDDVWSCSSCGADVTALYPDDAVCQNCRRDIQTRDGLAQRRVDDRDHQWWEALCMVDNVAPDPAAVKKWVIAERQMMIKQKDAEIVRLKDQVRQLELVGYRDTVRLQKVKEALRWEK